MTNHPWTRRVFLGTGVAAWVGTSLPGLAGLSTQPVNLPQAHREALSKRKRRIVVQYDAHDNLCGYAKVHADGNAPFAPFRDALFTFVDEPGSQIDAIWWDVAATPVGAAYPSKLSQSEPHPLIKKWLNEGVDWITEMVRATRERHREVFWNHRISEVEISSVGGSDRTHADPMKEQHPDWVTPASWWKTGMWNLASPGLREHKVAVLRELVTRYDFDGIQIDFSRHMPCLPVGHQWELRDEVTEFMRMVRAMLLQEAAQRGRPILLSAKVPQTLEGCRVDGLDVPTWGVRKLVDLLTLGSRSMDVEVEAFRAALGADIQLQPCFDDHHATDGYRHGPIEFLRGVFANHLQRGADSVVTFNWSIAPPPLAKALGSEVGPPSQELAYHEVGERATMAGKDKIFALERRGGYPWSDGYFNRNDTAPLPAILHLDESPAAFIIHISDAPNAGKNNVIIRCVMFQAEEGDAIELVFNDCVLPAATRDWEWKDPQIFSPKPQPTSGGKGEYKIDPKQRLLRLEFAVLTRQWKSGANRVQIRVKPETKSATSRTIRLEKLEAHLRYSQ